MLKECVMDLGDGSRLQAETVLQDFVAAGRHAFPAPLDPAAAADLLSAIRAERAFDASLFLSEAAFDADPQYTGVNPRPGRNLLERFADRLGFVERDAQVVHALTTLLGEGYETLDRKIVCGVPAKCVPAWLKARIAGNPVNNLGAYVRPENRDVTYFYGIDFHQDLIDFKAREADFLTLYVYLHPVTAHDAPLFLLEGSHRLGASVFPHSLERLGPDAWRYDNGAAGTTEVRQRMLVAPLHPARHPARRRRRGADLAALPVRQEAGRGGRDRPGQRHPDRPAEPQRHPGRPERQGRRPDQAQQRQPGRIILPGYIAQINSPG
jgi:hypothetical protein